MALDGRGAVAIARFRLPGARIHARRSKPKARARDGASPARPASFGSLTATLPSQVRCGGRKKGCVLHSFLLPSSPPTCPHPDWFVADCRFDLGKPEAGALAWRAGHIPGAVHVDLERDLSAPVTPTTGRHPLPKAVDFARTLARLGIGNETLVVCYDAGPGAYAARLWWMLRWMGHDAVAVLDGGFAAWTAEGRPVSTDADARAPARFSPHSRPEMVCDAEAVTRALARGETLVDMRGAERFSGSVEPIDAVAGHVPGAVNLPFLENLGANGRFRAPADIAGMWQSRTGAVPGRAPICMCGSGVTACQGLLALEAAGISGGRLYAGSWSEWIRDPSRGIARGDT